ncbi:hypothetical protein SBOR_9431 [Sclerotinia borealis F-4128]|uniref:Uncharacterized protein n=1 Tax=Sclerotinia borealis (strain F-4128) TaxID=1432307 RepID=W9C374_SCLBF|nr:hypothetical protein SBOR_9431 [Sclerotinia borealis F-4128]
MLLRFEKPQLNYSHEIFKLENLEELIIVSESLDRMSRDHYPSLKAVNELKMLLREGFREKKKMDANRRIPEIIIYPVGFPLPVFRNELPTPLEAFKAWAEKRGYTGNPEDFGIEEAVEDVEDA